MTDQSLDETDRRLIDLLSQDARLSNRRIAQMLDVTEGTVRGRIKRLQKDRLIAFTAITSFDLDGNTNLAFVGIQADVDDVRQIAREIAKIPSITSVLVTLGRHNILAICLFRNMEHLHQISAETILSLPGVHHVETSIAVRTLKYNSRIVHLQDEET